LRGDDILDARHETGDQVKLAFADDRPMRVQQRAFGFVQSEHDFALGENGRFGRVDVLGRLFVARQNASAESHHAPLLVADGEDEPAAEAVVKVVGALLAHDQSGLFDERQIVMFALGPIDRVIPGLRRAAQAEKLHRLGETPRRAR
jgi:hypothetical protein